MRYQTVLRSALTAASFWGLALVSASKPLSAGTVWDYDFGTGTGAFTSGESTTFLPTPPAEGGTARVRIGSGGGAFELVNPGAGSSSLVGTASASSSVNKFSIYDFAGTGLFTLEAEVTFHGSSSGTWYLFAGNGSSFSDSTSFDKAEVFSGLRWDYASSGGLSTSRLSSTGSWLTTNVPSMAQDMTYRLKIYGNNTADAVEHGGLRIEPFTWDVLVDGELAVSGLAKGGLADGTPIDSFMMNGSGSAGNAATLTVTSLGYANVLAPEPQAWLLAAVGVVCCCGVRMSQKTRINWVLRPK
ncbi:MAG: hypothetical protein ACO3NZ_02210 [Pirellulales bacterium]